MEQGTLGNNGLTFEDFGLSGQSRVINPQRLTSLKQ